jgi:hypothetical protein
MTTLGLDLQIGLAAVSVSLCPNVVLAVEQHKMPSEMIRL